MMDFRLFVHYWHLAGMIFFDKYFGTIQFWLACWMIEFDRFMFVISFLYSVFYKCT